MKLSDILGLKI